MFLTLLVVVTAPLATQSPVTCDEVRRVRAALVADGSDDRAVRGLEQRVCGRPDGGGGGGVVALPARTVECQQLLILQALSRGADTGANTRYWPNGKIAQNGANTWYWPSGKIAQNGARSFYGPDGGLTDFANLLTRACRDPRSCRFLQELDGDARMAWVLALAL